MAKKPSAYQTGLSDMNTVIGHGIDMHLARIMAKKKAPQGPDAPANNGESGAEDAMEKLRLLESYKPKK